MKRIFVIAIVSVFYGNAGMSAHAQTSTVSPPTQSSSGLGSAVPNKQEVKKDEAAILPSAEGHQSSAAPTMVRDCTKKPADCTEPVSPGDKSTAAGVQSK